MPHDTSGGVRRALVIGIDDYPLKPLEGCVGDATLMASVLKERFAFDDANVTLLTNAAASKDAILTAFDALVAATQDGDTALVYYAGHGSQAPTPDDSESSGQESTLCLDDTEGAGHVDIYDDDVAKALTAMAKRTRHAVAIFDCCHSGTMGRGSARGTSRSTSRAPARTTRSRRPAGGTAMAQDAAGAGYVMISGSLDHEESKESALHDDPTVVHGALTWALTRELLAAQAGATWRDVFQRAAAAVTAANSEQHPQIAGDADREIFGMRLLPPPPSVRVLERTGTQVLLGGGVINGLTVGSRHAIFAAGTRAGDTGAPLGAVVVTSVSGTMARARIASEQQATPIAEGALAVAATPATVESVLALENTDPASRLKGGITLEVMRRKSKGVFEPATLDPATGMPVFDVGDVYTLRVTNTLAERVFINILMFTPERTIELLTQGIANELEAGVTWDLYTAYNLQWKATLDGDDGVQSYKAIASRKQVDLSAVAALGTARSGATFDGHVSDDDWTTVTVRTLIRQRVALASGAPGTVAGATITTRGGLTANARSAHASPVAAPVAEGSPLAAALAGEGVITQHEVLLTDADASASTRSADGPPRVEVQVADPGEGYAQVAMTTDASGLVTWHFAPPLDPAPATRDGSVAQLRTRTFSFDATPQSVPGSRGALMAIGQKLIKIYAFPIGKALIRQLAATTGERIELARTPYRLRSFTADNYRTNDVEPLDASALQQLGSGRALLMIHGTNSRTHAAFGGLPREFVVWAHQRYEGRVFAFDHPTLTHSPRRNIEQLLKMLPEGTRLDVDIICHSRGGLVSRVISERLADLSDGTRTIQVGSIVFVGSPNAGTAMADEAFIGDFLDTFTNLLNLVPTNGVTDALGIVLTLVKLVAQGLWDGLDGLRSMQPGGTFCTWLAEGTQENTTRYLALASDYTPTHPALVKLLTDRLADRVFKGARNDLVVPTDGVYAANGAPRFPIDGQVVFSDADGVPHTGFFEFPRTTRQIMAWLG